MLDRMLVSLTLMVLLASSALAATVTGSVTGPDGKPFMGAFVVAENAQNKMTVSVLSNQQGRYHIGNLPDATYKVRISAIVSVRETRTLSADRIFAPPGSTVFEFAVRTISAPASILSCYRARIILALASRCEL